MNSKADKQNIYILKVSSCGCCLGDHFYSNVTHVTLFIQLTGVPSYSIGTDQVVSPEGPL